MSTRIWFWIGIAVLIYLPVMLVWNLCHAQGHWQLGPHGVPIPLEGDVPGFYPDGTPINLVDCLILRSGHPELIYGLLGGMLLIAVMGIISTVQGINKIRREAEQLLAAWEQLSRESDSPVIQQEMQRLKSLLRKMSWFGRDPRQEP